MGLPPARCMCCAHLPSQALLPPLSAGARQCRACTTSDCSLRHLSISTMAVTLLLLLPEDATLLPLLDCTIISRADSSWRSLGVATAVKGSTLTRLPVTAAHTYAEACCMSTCWLFCSKPNATAWAKQQVQNLCWKECWLLLPVSFCSQVCRCCEAVLYHHHAHVHTTVFGRNIGVG